jgi:hypothetical protein
MQGINKLILILENTIGRLSSLSHDELCQKLKSVPFTSWFEQPGVKEKYKKPDLSEFEKGCSLTEAWEREPDNSQGKYYYRYITDSVRPCVSGAANFFLFCSVLWIRIRIRMDPHSFGGLGSGSVLEMPFFTIFFLISNQTFQSTLPFLDSLC